MIISSRSTRNTLSAKVVLWTFKSKERGPGLAVPEVWVQFSQPLSAKGVRAELGLAPPQASSGS